MRSPVPDWRCLERTWGTRNFKRDSQNADPNAPKPNNMVVVVTDDHGHILLQRRRDNDLWALPGGGMDLTDPLPGTAVREVEITGLVGTYTDPKYVIVYTNGEVRRQFNVCFIACITGGRLEISDKSTEFRFVPPEEIEQLPMHHTQGLRLQRHPWPPCVSDSGRTKWRSRAPRTNTVPRTSSYEAGIGATAPAFGWIVGINRAEP